LSIGALAAVPTPELIEKFLAFCAHRWKSLRMGRGFHQLCAGKCSAVQVQHGSVSVQACGTLEDVVDLVVREAATNNVGKKRRLCFLLTEQRILDAIGLDNKDRNSKFWALCFLMN